MSLYTQYNFTLKHKSYFTQIGNHHFRVSSSFYRFLSPRLGLLFLSLPSLTVSLFLIMTFSLLPTLTLILSLLLLRTLSLLLLLRFPHLLRSKLSLLSFLLTSFSCCPSRLWLLPFSFLPRSLLPLLCLALLSFSLILSLSQLFSLHFLPLSLLKLLFLSPSLVPLVPCSPFSLSPLLPSRSLFLHSVSLLSFSRLSFLCGDLLDFSCRLFCSSACVHAYLSWLCLKSGSWMRSLLQGSLFFPLRLPSCSLSELSSLDESLLFFFPLSFLALCLSGSDSELLLLSEVLVEELSDIFFFCLRFFFFFSFLLFFFLSFFFSSRSSFLK